LRPAHVPRPRHDTAFFDRWPIRLKSMAPAVTTCTPSSIERQRCRAVYAPLLRWKPGARLTYQERARSRDEHAANLLMLRSLINRRGRGGGRDRARARTLDLDVRGFQMDQAINPSRVMASLVKRGLVARGLPTNQDHRRRGRGVGQRIEWIKGSRRLFRVIFKHLRRQCFPA
jgi:hypothetical protein